MLYADNLVLITESEKELISKIRQWKQCLEKKGLKVNVSKTKVLISTGQKLNEECEEWPCRVCGKGVEKNSIQCIECKKWVHKRCSGIKGQLLKQCSSFVCKSCKKEDQGRNGQLIDRKGAGISEGVDIGNGGKLEKVEEFCYLGDF